MNASKFMDKQIMELSGTQTNDFLELLEPQQENNGGGKKEEKEILPSYDFQPTRTAGSPPPPIHLDGARPWASEDSKATPSNFRNLSSSEPHKPSEVIHKEGRDTYDTATMIEIDRTVKKYADNLLHALDGVSSRLTQMESRTRHLERSLDDLKVTIGDNCGSTEGKLRQLENILREVQTGVHFLRDKQEIAEAQMQIGKLQASEGDHQSPENLNTSLPDSRQHHLPLPPPQIQHSFQPPIASPQPPPVPALPALPAPNAPPPRQQNPPPVQFPPQVHQTQIPSLRETYFPQPGQFPEPMHQQYQVPPQQPQAQSQQPQAPPQQPQAPPQQQYQIPSQHPHPQPSQTNSPQLQPPFSHHPEESSPYMQSHHTYPPSARQSGPLNQPPSGPPPPSQQFYGPNPNMYEPPVSRPSLGQLPFSAGYGPPSGPGFSESYPYSGPPSHYSSSSMKLPPSAGGPSGGSNHPRLPTAHVLPQALPAGSSSGGSTGNRVAIDDVVDKVSTMGFSREQVRDTVRKLTENGQSVDLNVVLDKLMNDSDIQPQKGWYGR